MSEYDDLHDQYSPDDDQLMGRYTAMRAENSDRFFDVTEFESIIDHFMALYDTAEASLAIDKALSQHPNSFDIRMRKAQLLLVRGEGHEALSLTNALELVAPSDLELLIMKADILGYLDHFGRAQEYYTRALEGCDDQRRIEVLHSLGTLYARQGRELDAIVALAEVAKSRPWDPHALEVLREVYQGADLAEEGVRTFEALIDEAPYSFQLWLQVGLLHNHLMRWRECADTMEMALILVPEHPDALMAKAESHYQLDEYRQAITHYLEVKEVEGHDATIYCGIGECYEELGENEKALEYYQKSISLSPDCAEAYLGKAIVLDHLGHTERALGNLRIALDLDEGNYEYWHVYGEILSREGDLEGAVDALERSLELDKTDINVYKGYIDTLYDAGFYDRAFVLVSEAFDHIGKESIVYIRAVALAARLNRFVEAQLLTSMLLEADPRSGSKLLDYDEDFIGTLGPILELIREAQNNA